MITPRFSLSQDENTLTISIRAPYCCLRELDVDVDNETFLFLCKPYYLRLNLPGSIEENDNTKSSFDSDSGEFTFIYEKTIAGEHFKDLEFITKFLVTKVDASYDDGPKISLLSSEHDSNEIPECSLSTHGFGFAQQSHKNFVGISSEFSDVFEIDPTEVSLSERRKMRLQYEQGKFDMEHYLGDFIEDDEIQDIISQETPWCKLSTDSIAFTSKELDFLKDLHNTDYKLSEQQINYVNNGLIDILFAYCYDKRTTNFEENAESGWTITKLAATFCWLDAFDNTKEALVSAFRRSLIYPLYRNFELSLKILEDLKHLLRFGEKYLIKCLIEIYNIFLNGDCCRYILNNLFIKDYIVYIMKWDRDKWQKMLQDNFNQINIQKEDLGLNLSEIEEGFSLDQKFSKLIIKENDSDDDDSSSDDSESDSESSEDEE